MRSMAVTYELVHEVFLQSSLLACNFWLCLSYSTQESLLTGYTLLKEFASQGCSLGMICGLSELLITLLVGFSPGVPLFCLPQPTLLSCMYSDIFYFLASCKKQRKSGTSACSHPLSAPTIKLLMLIFLHFRVQYDFLTYLAKFQSTNIKSNFIWTFIFENLRSPLLDLVSRLDWLRIRENDIKYSKIPHGLKL